MSVGTQLGHCHCIGWYCGIMSPLYLIFSAFILLDHVLIIGLTFNVRPSLMISEDDMKDDMLTIPCDEKCHDNDTKWHEWHTTQDDTVVILKRVLQDFKRVYVTWRERFATTWVQFMVSVVNPRLADKTRSFPSKARYITLQGLIKTT